MDDLLMPQVEEFYAEHKEYVESQPEDEYQIRNFISERIIVTAVYVNGVMRTATGSKVRAELIELNNVKVVYPSGKTKFYPLNDELQWIEEGVPLTV